MQCYRQTSTHHMLIAQCMKRCSREPSPTALRSTAQCRPRSKDPPQRSFVWRHPGSSSLPMKQIRELWQIHPLPVVPIVLGSSGQLKCSLMHTFRYWALKSLTGSARRGFDCIGGECISSVLISPFKLVASDSIITVYHAMANVNDFCYFLTLWKTVLL